jgi:hypothetical protein
MSWTKRDFIRQAFDELGLASYVYDLTADQLDAALRRLDGMMATWNAKGIRVGYPLPLSPGDSDIDEATAVPDRANEAIYQNLAVRLAPSYGKLVSPDTKQSAKMAYDALLSYAAMPPEMQLPQGMPLGAGVRAWRGQSLFTSQPDDPIAVGPDGLLEY